MARHRGFPQNRQQHRPVLGNMESPPRRHEQRTGSPYGTGAASRPRRRGSPGAVFHRRAIPPRLERFRSAPTPESPVRRNMACIQPKTILMQESHKTARISKVTALASYRTPHLVSAIGGRMPVSLQQFFNSANTVGDSASLFLQNGGESVGDTSSLHGIHKLSRSAKAEENRATVTHS